MCLWFLTFVRQGHRGKFILFTISYFLFHLFPPNESSTQIVNCYLRFFDFSEDLIFSKNFDIIIYIKEDRINSKRYATRRLMHEYFMHCKCN